MTSNSQHDGASLEQLRRLLLGKQLEELEQLKQQLQNRDKFSDEVSKILPDAMIKSAQQGEQLSQAMVPTVEEIVRLSIKRDINKFATALFPVIGPAIRKAISETIRQMLQSLNQTLEYGLSWRGIKWRTESIRTGIPFAQVVMLHSLIYRVEQVFLIHRESGLLLNHVQIESAVSQDADMVSSMLSAIGDFVGDSFQVENRQGLDAIQVADFSILIEQGPDAILAVAVRGEAPGSLRNVLQQALEDIQRQFGEQLQHFSGDTEIFMPTRTQLLQCLDQAKYKPKKKKISLRTWLVLFALLLLAFYWMVANIYRSQQQHDYVNLLQQEPGYVITETNYDGDNLSISGLKDPLARDPKKFIALSTLDPAAVHLQFEPYQSLKPPFVEQRLQKILNPPANTQLQFNHGLVTLSGYASAQKAQAMRTMAALIGGVTQVDSSALKSRIDLSSLQPPASVKLDLDLDNGILRASGKALPAWREQARQQATQLDGIRHYDDSQLDQQFDLSIFNAPDSVVLSLQHGILRASGHASDEWAQSLQQKAAEFDDISEVDISQLRNDTAQQLEQDIAELEQQKIFFDVALSFNFDANGVFNRVVTLVKRLLKNAQQLSQPLQIVVRGHSDSVGSFDDNRALSIDRADYVTQYLFNTGISPRFILIKGIEAPVPKEKSAAEQSFNRRVTFEVKRTAQS
jgi:OOP family OmpA-OmpF porin